MRAGSGWRWQSRTGGRRCEASFFKYRVMALGAGRRGCGAGVCGGASSSWMGVRGRSVRALAEGKG